ncbi:PPA1309 family protein [Propionicimonas sp.]|uniref:PPA1309 family protein n=1 Tax=Propionicimonas sp. TaxID=1955623 RepID=UPI0039E3ECBA
MNDALVAALVEVERHVGRLGWDQPARLFALVRTADLLAAEPSLAAHLSGATPDGFSSIEQEDFRPGTDLAEALARITWPPTVAGCVLALERAFLPADAEEQLPTDPDEAARVVAAHPRRLDLRVVVGVTRDSDRYGVARVRGEDGDLLSGADLVPALASALAHTLE